MGAYNTRSKASFFTFQQWSVLWAEVRKLSTEAVLTVRLDHDVDDVVQAGLPLGLRGHVRALLQCSLNLPIASEKIVHGALSGSKRKKEEQNAENREKNFVRLHP